MKKILLLIGSFLLTLLLLEVYLRGSEIETPSIVIVDDQKGVKYKPNSINATFLEGFALTKTNNDGYLFPDYSEKDDNITISLISDSYINGLYLFDRHHVRNLLELNLNNNNLQKSFRVLRFGQSGGNISDFYIWQNLEAKKFNTDLSFILIENDDFKFVGPSNLMPYCELVGSDIQINYSFNKSSAYRFKSRLTPYSGISTLRLALKCFKKLDNFKQIVLDIKPKITKSANLQYNTNELLTPLNRKIITSLSEENVIFVFKSKMHPSIVEFFNKQHINYIELNELFEVMRNNGIEPTYWVGTKKYGHWNHKTQVEISKLLEYVSIDYFSNASLIK